MQIHQTEPVIDSSKNKIDELQERTRLQIDEMQNQINKYALKESEGIFENDTAKIFLKNLTQLVMTIQESFREIKLKTI